MSGFERQYLGGRSFSHRGQMLYTWWDRNGQNTYANMQYHFQVNCTLVYFGNPGMLSYTSIKKTKNKWKPPKWTNSSSTNPECMGQVRNHTQYEENILSSPLDKRTQLKIEPPPYTSWSKRQEMLLPWLVLWRLEMSYSTRESKIFMICKQRGRAWHSCPAQKCCILEVDKRAGLVPSPILEE